MKVIIASLVLCCLLPTLLGTKLKTIGKAPFKPCCVKLYEEANFKGKEYDACGEDPSFTGIKISSFLMPKGCTIQFYENTNHKGLRLSFEGPIKDMGRYCAKTFLGCQEKWFNSFRVYDERPPCCLTFYEGKDFEGENWEICEDTPNLEKRKISSVWMPEGCSVHLHKKENYEGGYRQLSGPRKDITDLLPLKKEWTSSLNIYGKMMREEEEAPSKRCCIKFYEKTSWNGEGYKICEDTTNFNGDKIESIRMPDDCTITLYTKENYQGVPFPFKSSVTDFQKVCFGRPPELCNKKKAHSVKIIDKRRI